MQLLDLPSELLLQILYSAETVDSAISLSKTCHRLYGLFSGPQHLTILFSAISHEFSPIGPCLHLATFNNSKPNFNPPSTKLPLSRPLLATLLYQGRTAARWAALYPMHHWRGPDSPSRRLLSALEAHRVRRAIYRLWLYSTAFHVLAHTRRTRRNPEVIRARATLVRNWSSTDLAELQDVRELLRRVVAKSVCPDDGSVRKHILLRDPNADVSIAPRVQQPCSGRGRRTATAAAAAALTAPLDELEEKMAGLEMEQFVTHRTVFAVSGAKRGMDDGWGDAVEHYYAVQDMLKLDPATILWLAEDAHLGRRETRDWITEATDTVAYAEWFENNGETLGETVDWVLEQRGWSAEEVEDWNAEIASGERGCVSG